MDVPLTPLGETQAEKTAKKLSRTSIHKIYSSPLKRAYDTARRIAEKQNAPIQIEILPEFSDIHYGAWQGLSLSVVKAQFEPKWNVWAKKPHAMKFPEGESVEEVSKRALAAANKVLLAHPDETIAFVAHRIITRSLMLLLLGQPLSSLITIRHDPCSITTLEKQPYGFVLICHNDTCHLKANSTRVLSPTSTCTLHTNTKHGKGFGEDASPRIRGDSVKKIDAREREPLWKWRALCKLFLGHNTRRECVAA